MNTGIQDMIDLCWNLAFVLRDGAPKALLDTYESERLPIMRDVLSKTERLTDIVDLLAPWIVGSPAVAHRAAARVSQISLGCLESPVSGDHGHLGSLRAGDRLPDRTVVRVGGGETRLFTLLDPSRFVVLAHGLRDAEAEAVVAAIRPWGNQVALVPVAVTDEPAAAERFREDVGSAGGLHVVRPDGTLGFVGGPDSAKALAGWLGERPVAA